VKILASVTSLDEARIVTDLGFDIVDVKNPAEGSLGAQPPWVIAEIAEFANSVGSLVSVALGDMAFQPGTAALAAFGAAQFPIQFIKLGLHGTQSLSEALAMLKAVRSAVRIRHATVSLVAAGYGDYRRFGGLAPEDLVRAAQHDCDVVMLDTAIKDGSTLFDAMRFEEIEAFIGQARQLGLKTALAGSLRGEHLPLIDRLGPDIFGVRGALCAGHQRGGQVDRKAASRFIDEVRALRSTQSQIVKMLGTCAR
jgi:uncharacterized protein (UPF0264 family)